MKKITILTLLVLICTSIFSQEFMGIKVGGKLNDVVLKFRANGFVSQKNEIPDVAIMKLDLNMPDWKTDELFEDLLK